MQILFYYNFAILYQNNLFFATPFI